MTKHQAKPLLELWLKRHHDLEAVLEKMEECVDLAGTPLYECVWRVFDGYTESLNAQLGDDVQSLQWFIYENGAGKKGLKATPSAKNRLRKIKKVNDLIWLLDLPEK